MRLAVLLLIVVGCQAPKGPATKDDVRRSAEAEQLTRNAADLIDSDAEAAEALLQEALAADLFFGPAHNNLGVLHLRRGNLYEAASEFEWARKLMPGHPDPRLNLAITLEKAGRSDDALSTYTAALEVYPDYLPAVQGLASLSIRAGKEDARLPGWLQAIALRSEDPKWREWSLRHLAKRNW